MSVRAKFCLQEVTESAGSNGKSFRFTAQYDPAIPEDRVFQKYSPSGEFKIFCNNPAVIEQFKVGQFYYFDITPVPPPEPATAA